MSTDDRPVNARSPDSGSSSTHKSRFTALEDVWLDEVVWSIPLRNSGPVVSYVDIETLVE